MGKESIGPESLSAWFYQPDLPTRQGWKKKLSGFR